MAEYKSTTSKGECIFCKIAKGEIQSMAGGNFFDSDKYMAWLSPFPNTEGFAIIIPKKHYGSDVLAMPDNELGEFVSEAKKVSSILLKYFKDVGRVGLIMEGTGIDHAHIKLFPMHGTKHMTEGEWKQYHSDNDKFFENYEGYISSHDGPKADEEKIQKMAEELRAINKSSS